MTEAINSGLPCAIDIETNMLKPDGDDARIVACSFSTKLGTYSYPWTSRTRQWTNTLIWSQTPFIASNLQFENRWFIKEFGQGVCYWKDDSMLRGHWDLRDLLLYCGMDSLLERKLVE